MEHSRAVTAQTFRPSLIINLVVDNLKLLRNLAVAGHDDNSMTSEIISQEILGEKTLRIIFVFTNVLTVAFIQRGCRALSLFRLYSLQHCYSLFSMENHLHCIALWLFQ